MTMKSRSMLMLVLILPFLFLAVSCAKQAVGTETETAPTTPAPTTSTQSDADKRAAEEAAREAQLREERLRAEATAKAQDRFLNENIHFEFDSAAITAEAQRILNEKAAYLRANPNLRVTVEGHCDERGTAAYNMALGERRADSVKAFLVNLGIPAGRLNTISYGEERPLVTGSGEEAWAKNRRAQFVIN